MTPGDPASSELLRATVFHTPGNPFQRAHALEAFSDGGLLISGGRIAACGDYAAVRDACPRAPIRDLRGGFLVPGFIDAHVHYPQIRILGALGYSLLDWLEKQALPEEAKFADREYAQAVASEFVGALLSHGTTTALVFGSHFAPGDARRSQHCLLREPELDTQVSRAGKGAVCSLAAVCSFCLRGHSGGLPDARGRTSRRASSDPPK
jgi:cytosine/adenosine deaminase-related metal-dependent hydrolase